MIDIRGDGDLIDVQHRQEWDSTLNNHIGGNKVVIDVQPGHRLTQLVNDFENLKDELEAMKLERENEEALRKTHPGLRELYDQYQVVFKLVKKADAAEKDINS